MTFSDELLLEDNKYNKHKQNLDFSQPSLTKVKKSDYVAGAATTAIHNWW